MKRVLSIILCLAMIFSFCTVYASARDVLIVINGTSVDRENKSGTGWTFNNGNELVLTNYNGGKIELGAVSDLTIVLNGENTITSKGEGITSNLYLKPLKITGTGSLTINADGIGIVAPRIDFNGGRVTINAGVTAIYATSKASATSYASINFNEGSKVVAKSVLEEAIKADTTVSFAEGCSVKATSQNMAAIIAYGTKELDNLTGKWADSTMGTPAIKIAEGYEITPANLAVTALNGETISAVGEAYDASQEYYGAQNMTDEYYASDLNHWSVVRYYKGLTLASGAANIDYGTWTYSGAFAKTFKICYTTPTAQVFDETENDETIIRVWGGNKVQTSLASAEAMKKALDVEKFDNIIIASGDNYPDALAGSYLAAVKEAPIILVRAKDAEKVAAYVKDNFTGAGNIYILGGAAAVSENIENTLKTTLGTYASNVKRLSGGNRYETGRLILAEAGFTGNELIVCTGQDFADALSVSSLGRPVFLVNTKKNVLTADDIAYLASIKDSVDKVYFIGGTKALSAELQAAVEAQLDSSVESKRLAGSNRYESSTMIADEFFSGASVVSLAYAKNFPDGLAAGPISYLLGAPVILVAPDKCDFAAEFINGTVVENTMIFGGEAAVASSVVTSLFTDPVDANTYYANF